MDLRYTFNEDVQNYDKYRPTYCQELFKDINLYAKLNETKLALEVGIGSGQATRPILMTGCEVKAVDIGKDFVDYTKEKFNEYKKFSVNHTSFEAFECETNQIDLLYSATAFHWIPEDVGYPKALKLLKEDGVLALFWNKPFVSREDDSLHQQIQSVYQKYRPSNTKWIEHDKVRYKKMSEMIQSYGFKDVEVKLYHQIRTFDAIEYINLLNTYSDHRSMETSIKPLFENEIKQAIVDNGNVLTIYDTIELYLARK
ncbi:MAG: class I SAM-dependent methyltransferase [Turicibacter sp.]